MRTWQPAVLGIGLILLAACGEVETVPSQAPTEAVPRTVTPTDGVRRSVSIGSQTPPASVPDEYQHYTWLDLSVDAGFLSGNIGYGQAVENYSGNNASADIDLTARNAVGTLVASNSAHAQDSHIFPGDYGITASTNVSLPAGCGITLQASGTGSVWDSFFTTSLSLLTWGKKTESATKSISQPSCAAPPPDTSTPTSGGGGDGSGSTTTTTPPPEPDTYYPPWYEPSGHWDCVEEYNYSTYEYVTTCYWRDDNDAQLPRAGAPLLSRALVASSPSAASLGDEELPSVFVIVSDAIPAAAMAVVERHKQGPFRNVLLVRSSTVRPAVFAAAMRILYEARSRDGEIPASDRSVQLRGTILDQEIPVVARDYAAAFTGLLQQAKRFSLGSYGTHPALNIRMGAARK
jgi:hypothetical protein